MGQKIHPVGFRIGITKKHQSQWFARPSEYSFFLLEDRFLRNYLLQSFRDASISYMGIQRKSNEQDQKTNEVFDLIKIEIRAASPGILIGRNGQAVQQLRDDLEKKLQKSRQKQNKPNVRIAMKVNDVPNPYSEAVLIAGFLVEQLEERVAFRRALRKTLRLVKIARLQGVKLQISGRLNGAEIARTEWIRKGRVPLQTLRADIDYSYRTANTIYGILGIKVWAFRGDISETILEGRTFLAKFS